MDIKENKTKILSPWLIRSSKICSKIKFVGSMWNLNDRVVLVVLNPTQLISHETDLVCSQKHAMSIFSDR